MYYNAKNVKYISGYTLEILFENGEKGTIDFSNFPKRKGVFKKFSDPDYFKKVHIDEEWGVLCWPGDVDLAPETVYSMATGKPLPEWMEI